jgi:hypothetical protein
MAAQPETAKPLIPTTRQGRDPEQFYPLPVHTT